MIHDDLHERMLKSFNSNREGAILGASEIFQLRSEA